jgi:predicted oxidoreductase
LRAYPARVKTLKQGRIIYLQVVQDIRLDDGRQTTKVIKSYGQVTDENLSLANNLMRDLNAHLSEPDAPQLEINPAQLRSLEEGPILGIISPELTPRVWYGLYAIVNRFFQRNITSEEGLRRTIELTQPDLQSEEERARFYNWIRHKPREEQARILIKRWYY